MKKIIFISFIILFNLANCYSQDLIVRISGDVIRAKIIEVQPFEIIYKIYDNLQGDSLEILGWEILMIKYQNGSIDFYQKGNKIKVLQSVNADSLLLVIQAERDVTDNYEVNHVEIAKTFLITYFGTPVLGIIPVVKYNSAKLEDNDLNCPKQELLNNQVYHDAYVKKVKKLRHKKLWGSWAGGLVLNIFSIGILLITANVPIE
jgi:hypothetical protein